MDELVLAEGVVDEQLPAFLDLQLRRSRDHLKDAGYLGEDASRMALARREDRDRVASAVARDAGDARLDPQPRRIPFAAEDHDLVMTDGKENASRECGGANFRRLVADSEKKRA